VFIPIFLGVIHKTSYCIHQASILPFHLTISKRDYDVNILEKQYKKGDLVYVLDTASIKGKV
jgi:hypothetical protein